MNKAQCVTGVVVTLVVGAVAIGSCLGHDFYVTGLCLTGLVGVVFGLALTA